jgi:Spy/CpxP family protein refolding chaperone
MRLALSFVMSLLIVRIGSAQTVPADRDVLERGSGAGMGSYADLNGYPGPKHILEMRDTLQLTDNQEKDIEAIFDEMSGNARAKGEQVIAREEELHARFKNSAAMEPEIRRLAGEIGRLRGELRAVHLTAHIQARRVLTKEQIALYNTLRHGTAHHASGAH